MLACSQPPFVDQGAHRARFHAEKVGSFVNGKEGLVSMAAMPVRFLGCFQGCLCLYIRSYLFTASLYLYINQLGANVWHCAGVMNGYQNLGPLS